MITKETLRVLGNNMKFVGTVNRQFDDRFGIEGAKIGQTLNIRKPNRFTTTLGPGLVIQDIVEQSVPVILTSQRHVDFQFTSKDRLLNIDMFSERLIKPAANALLNQIDTDGLALVNSTVYQAVGTPGTTPNTALLYLQAGQKLNEAAAPLEDRSAVINAAATASSVDALKALYNPQVVISEQYKKGMLAKDTLGFDFYMDQNVASYQVGVQGGSGVTNGANQIGQSIVTNGWTASVTNLLRAGDIITFSGVYACNPVSFLSTGSLKQFLVTANCNSDSGGNCTIPILGGTGLGVVASGPFQNICNSASAPLAGIPNASAITVLGAANTVSPSNISYHKDAFVFACANLPVPQGVDLGQMTEAAGANDVTNGLSLRIVRAYDITNDLFPCRIDTLYGWATMYAELACRIQG